MERYSWRLLALSAAVVFGLGCMGVKAQQPELGPFDWVYGSLQLFWVNGQIDSRRGGWLLQFARIAGPVLTSTAILKSAASAFRQGYDQFLGKRVMRNHVIVCGCGEIGYRFATAVADKGLPVLVIERSRTAPFVDDAQRQGIPVLFGDGSDLRTLQSAGLHRADWVAALTSDDDANLRIAEIVDRDEIAHTKCLVHVAELVLWPLACRKFRDRDRIRPVNVHEEIAIALLNAADPFPKVDESPASIVVIGGNDRAEALIVHVAKRWQTERTDDASRLTVTLVDDQAGMWVEHLTRSYPGIDEMVNLVTEETAGELDSVLVARLNRKYAYDLVYVADADPTRASSLALALNASLPNEASTKVVALASRNCPILTQSAWPNLFHVDWGRSLSDVDGMLNGASDEMARLAHEAYSAGELASAKAEGRKPRPVARYHWDELPEFLAGQRRPLDHVRRQNRDQAAYTATLLSSVGCGTTSLLDWDRTPFTFDADEVVELARMEHARWWGCMQAMGFKPAPDLCTEDGQWSTDYAKRRTPFYVEYDKLPIANRLLDQDAVKRIPAKLALVGLRPIRRETAR